MSPCNGHSKFNNCVSLLLFSRLSDIEVKISFDLEVCFFTWYELDNEYGTDYAASEVCRGF